MAGFVGMTGGGAYHSSPSLSSSPSSSQGRLGQSIGCQIGQGRLFGDAISSAAFLELLQRQDTGEYPALRVPA